MSPHIINPSVGAPMESGTEPLFHVFLPLTYTPTTNTPNAINETLLTQFNLVLNHALPSTSLTLRSFLDWEVVQSNLDPGPTCAIISTLQVGQTLPIYVHEQNSAFLITEQKDGCLTVSTFRLSLPSEKVSGNSGAFATKYPTHSVTVRKSRLVPSKSLIRHLHDLSMSDMREAVATIKKSRADVVEKRDVSDPIYISRWLLGLLLNDESRQSNEAEFPTLFKKIRDSVRLQDGRVFRRSPFWVCIKTSLNLLLVKELGVEIGRFAYKTILLRFMVELIKSEPQPTPKNTTLVEYLAKIGRRVFKLEQLCQSEFDSDFEPMWLYDFYNETLKLTSATLKVHHDNLKMSLLMLIEDCKQMSTFDLSDIKLWLHLTLKANHFSSELIPRLQSQSRSEMFSKVGKIEPPILLMGYRHTDYRSLFDIDGFDTKVDLNITLVDFSRNVSIWGQMLCELDSNYVWSMFKKYLSVGKELYRSDTLAYSQFIFTLLKIIKLWDEICCSKFPILAKHASGVDMKNLRHLLLTHRFDLTKFNQIETYFEFRDKRATGPSLIEEHSPTVNSFANQYAQTQPVFATLRHHILEIGKEYAASKLKEVHEAREKSDAIASEIRSLECEYEITEFKKKHDWKNCKKCKLARLEKAMSVTVYEAPLPVGAECQNAVIFELLIPQQIGVLRDMLFLFHHEVMGVVASEATLYGPWHDYEQVKVFSARPRQFLVGLYSERKLFCDTHYRSLHPSNPDADFVRHNGFNCVYSSENSYVAAEGPGLKGKTTFRVEKKSRYSRMQYGIDGVLTQNEVIARQIECHPDLSLTEFISFGSLRSVPNLQWRNLLSALNSGSLSLKEESVFNLICQVMWSMGPQVSNHYLRENQLDFASKEFCDEFLDILGKIRETSADNWKDTNVILTVILLTQMIAQLNPVSERKGFKLLQACRTMAVEWSASIHAILRQASNQNRENIDSLRLQLVNVNAVIALSFNVDEVFLYEVIVDGEFINWLLAVAQIHDNLVLLGDYRLKTCTKNLLNRVDELGVRLEPFIKEAIRSSDLLTCFVEKHHTGSKVWNMRYSQKMEWKSFSDGQIYYCDILPVGGVGDVSRIQIDIIKGKFLVDNSPVGYLPITIEKHRNYIRVFGTKSFSVQPYAFCKGRLITNDSFWDSHYSFYLMGDELIINEHRGKDDEQLELISDEKFLKNVPTLLVRDFSHWYSKKSNHFEFFKKDKKLTSTKPEYILELVERQLYSTKNGEKVVIDISCPGYLTILSIIEKLELAEYVLIACDMSGYNYTYTVELPRMGLQFSVRNVSSPISESNNRRAHQNHTAHHHPLKRRLGDLVSKEWRGMRISTRQGALETLIGLKHCLLLEDADKATPAKMNGILLIPHGKPVPKDEYVVIDITEIRNPPFFAYEIDERLKQLKSGDNKAALIYLAYLHALTNHDIVDPFTGVSGFERALQILQSGQCFSSEPLDEESLKTLEMFLELCPVRVFYPPDSQIYTVSKYSSIPVRCASDAYYLIVDQLIRDSSRLNFLYPEWKGYDLTVNREYDLIYKGYFHKHYYSTELGRLTGDFLPEAPETVKYFEPSTVDETTVNTIALSQDIQKWTCSKTKPTCLVRALLLNGHDVKGVSLGESFPICDGLYTWTRLDFRDCWIDLYNLARTVKKKELQTEWTYLLTYLSFRRDPFISMDQLNFLHTIAVHSEEFEEIEPPVYDLYTNTKEISFNKQEIKDILARHRFPLDYRLDLNDKKEWEDYLMFIDRMKAEKEAFAQDQIDSIVDEIEKQWPVDNVDWLNPERANRTEINFIDASKEINLILKSQYKNKQLSDFLSTVEQTVAGIRVLVKGKPDYRRLFKQGHTAELEKFCARPMVTIDFSSLAANKQFKLSDESTLDQARKIFHVDPSHYKEKTKLTINTDIPEFPINIQSEDPIMKEYLQDLQSSWKCFHQQQGKKTGKEPEGNGKSSNNQHNRLDVYATELRKNKQLCLEFWEKIKDTFLPRGKGSLSVLDQILCYSELYPRILPITMLSLLLTTPDKDEKFLKGLRDLVGAYGVLMTKEQKSSRCFRLAKSQKSQTDFLELQTEVQNHGHENWDPSQRPEWLLFEIESDLMIRPIQARVADRMEKPLNNENALIQLNMGEGKTLVIVPLLALSLADGTRLCRVTVLKSLFQINKTYISFRIGSILLNRRLYLFPSRRDMKISSASTNVMLEIYEECLDLKGVVLVLPEYRLSFELKAYERCHCRQFEEARALFKVQEWLKKNVVDVLDESDEILHVKYQLVYTLGKQLTVGGGNIRFSVVQDILSVVPEEFKKLQEEYGPSFVELKERTNAFPFCRILKTECIPELINRIAERIINKQTPIRIPSLQKKIVKPLFDFFTQEQLSREGLNCVLKAFPESTQELLLIIRGYLACGVLANCLTKRWRVNYGVNTNNEYRRMAVPFRAKDVASDKLEFGHPDIGINFTQLSYYYSGLTNEQIEHCFVILYLEPNPALEYSKWVNLLPDDETKKKICHLSTVNLNDFFQKTQVLFPLLKFNRNLINFFLSRVVFPHESKQFGWKMGSTPWDLTTTATSGFSGTSCRLLLPSTIKQRDLPSLKGTDGMVLSALLQQKDNYEVVENVSAVKILKKLVDSNIRILLDVGALMLELNNEEVCRKWLQLLEERDIEVDAAVFFDTNDKLVVLDRTNTITEFTLSTFRNRIERTVIFLDQVHTRGTDLRIPSNNTACVTLGPKLVRDQISQGAMRMRKLGQGHSVKFWASEEVNDGIRSFHTGPGPITSKEVIIWSIHNTMQQIKDGFIHWSAAGVLQSQKLSGLEIFKNSHKTDSDLVLLSEQVSQKEQISLHQMYGDVRTVVAFPVIVDHLLKRANRELGKLLAKKNNSKVTKIDCSAIVESYGENVRRHVNLYVPNMIRSTQLLQEEQERELEHELEQICQKQMPLRAKPMEHVESLQVTRFIKEGSLHEIEKWATKLPLAFKNTSIWKTFSNDKWGRHIYCSKDFVNVVKLESRLSDDYLRPVEWLAVVQLEDGKMVVILLSNFEAGLYLNLFRSNGAKATLHMFSALVHEGQANLHEKKAVTVPMRQVPFDRATNASLALFGGSLFFASKKDEEDYAWYLCYVMGEICDRILEEGGCVGGWIKKEYWPFVNVSGVFTECPEALVKEILRCRYGVKKVGPETGVGRILGSD